jgi:hypothetical protein
MKQPKNLNNLLFAVDDVARTIIMKIKDYKSNIHDNPTLKSKFYNIDFVYMHSILLDLAKLLSTGRNDKSGLSELEKISPPDLKKSISAFKKQNDNQIKKIKSNRDRIIAHIDISDVKSYMKMGFSESEINKKVKDYSKYLELLHIDMRGAEEKVISDLKALVSSSIEDERYSPSDFFNELDTFSKIANEILEIAGKLRFHFYQITKS